MHTYKNIFYNVNYQNSCREYTADLNSIIYKGYEIHRYSSINFHIVKDGVCIGMMAGINGAKGRIDKIVESLSTGYHKETVSKYPANTWVKPTNNGCNDYSVFQDLFEWGLCERKIEPQHRGKTFIGNTVSFKYNNF